MASLTSPGQFFRCLLGIHITYDLPHHLWLVALVLTSPCQFHRYLFAILRKYGSTQQLCPANYSLFAIHRRYGWAHQPQPVLCHQHPSPTTNQCFYFQLFVSLDQIKKVNIKLGDWAYIRRKNTSSTKGMWDPTLYQIIKVFENQIVGRRQHEKKTRDRYDWKLLVARPPYLQEFQTETRTVSAPPQGSQTSIEGWLAKGTSHKSSQSMTRAAATTTKGKKTTQPTHPKTTNREAPEHTGRGRRGATAESTGENTTSHTTNTTPT